MNRVEFMQRLEMLLSDISETERADALKYYNDYFDDAGFENEAGVIEQLGSPEQVAHNIKAESYGTIGNESVNHTYSSQDAPFMNQGNHANQGQSYTNTQSQNNNRDGSTLALIVVLIIVTFPFWIGAVGALFGITVGLTVGGGGIIIGGIALIGAAIAKMLIFPMGGVFLLGVSFLLIALGLTFLVGGLSIILIAIPAIVKGISSLIKKAFGKKGEV